MSMAGLRVLVTRPANQADNWCARLESLGAITLKRPLMQIAGIDGQSPLGVKADNIIRCLDSYQHAVFVSQNAVDFGLQAIRRHWPQMPSQITLYAVGSATARRLENSGLTCCAADGAMNTEALLALPELQNVDGQRVLIVRGLGGHPVMAEVLSARGAQVDFCELYERRYLPGAHTFLRECAWGQTGDIVSLHSGQSLEYWQRVIDESGESGWLALPVIVPGQRVADQAERTGFTTIIMATNATDGSMSEALQDWYARKGTDKHEQ